MICGSETGCVPMLPCSTLVLGHGSSGPRVSLPPYSSPLCQHCCSIHVCRCHQLSAFICMHAHDIRSDIIQKICETVSSQVTTMSFSFTWNKFCLQQTLISIMRQPCPARQRIGCYSSTVHIHAAGHDLAEQACTRCKRADTCQQNGHMYMNSIRMSIMA